MIVHLQQLGVPVHIDDLADKVQEIETANDDVDTADPDFPGDGDSDGDEDETYLDDEDDNE